MQLPIKVSTLMTPLVDVERVIEQNVARTGLPTIPGPLAVTQQVVASVESAIEGLPSPTAMLQQITAGLPALPTAPAAQPAAPQAAVTPPPRVVKVGKVI